MASSSTKPVRDEIDSIAAILGDAQRRLDELAVRLEDNVQQKYHDLEASYKEALNSANWLRTQNVDLQSRLENQRPELNNAIAARDDAFSKLKHARKVIRDLLTEREDMSSPGTRKSTYEDIKAALGVEFLAQSSASSSSGSGRTVRLHAINSPPPAERSALSSPHRSKSTVHRSSPKSLPTRSNTEPAINRSPNTPLGELQFSPSAGPSRLSMSELIAQDRTQIIVENNLSNDSPEQELIFVHFKNPPGVSVVQEGPLSWEMIRKSLNNNDNTYNALRSLEKSVDLNMRLCIDPYDKKTPMAFIFDPILVDVPGRSYLVEWGRPKSTQNQKRYIVTNKADDAVFHTFLYPTSEKHWFYVGAMEWTVLEHAPNYWEILDEHSKKVLLRKLTRRTGGQIQEADMDRMLENGELQQICIELTLAGDPLIARDFVSEVIRRSNSPYSPGARDR